MSLYFNLWRFVLIFTICRYTFETDEYVRFQLTLDYLPWGKTYRWGTAWTKYACDFIDVPSLERATVFYGKTARTWPWRLPWKR